MLCDIKKDELLIVSVPPCPNFQLLCVQFVAFALQSSSITAPIAAFHQAIWRFNERRNNFLWPNNCTGDKHGQRYAAK